MNHKPNPKRQAAKLAHAKIVLKSGPESLGIRGPAVAHALAVAEQRRVRVEHPDIFNPVVHSRNILALAAAL